LTRELTVTEFFVFFASFAQLLRLLRPVFLPSL
jgi:hypothetical protein